jgi:hypothetical protein
LGITLVFGIFYFGFVKPDPNLNWTPDQARTPSVELKGDFVTVRNVRDFEWRSRTDFTPHYNDKTYDLRKLISMHYVVAPLGSAQAVAHVFLAFGFSDGQTVSISVEGRREEGKPYQVIPSLFRRFQLIYVVGEERDVVGLRGAIWKTTVQFYPLRSTQERKRALFLSMVNRAESLDENPEFYNLLTNNCMNNIVRHVRELGGPVLPRELALLLTGLSDSVAYDFGFLDTDLPFEKARVAFRVDPWMDTATLDKDFPRNLREQIDRQVQAMKIRNANPVP